MINLNEVIDTLLNYIYVQEKLSSSVSSILTNAGYEYTYANSYIICDKVSGLDLFQLIKAYSSDGADYIIQANATGYEFIQLYGTYSNYLVVSQKEKKRQDKLQENDARGSFWGGIAGVVSLFASVVFFVYTSYQDSKQDKINDALIKSNEQLRKQLQQKGDINVIRQLIQQNMDSLANLKKK